MLVEAFRKENVPCFMQHGVASGLELSPFIWSYLVPGLQYIVYVPPNLKKSAERILLDMPFDMEEETIRERRGLLDKNQGIFKAIIIAYLFFFVIAFLSVIGWYSLLIVCGIAAVSYWIYRRKEKMPER
jgi:hypothetical protein